jgi:hypothetical protein
MQDTGRNNPKPCKSKCTWYWTRRSHAEEAAAVRPMAVHLTNYNFEVVAKLKI